MPALHREPVQVVVEQHVESAASLRRTRSVLVRAPHVRLMHLRRLDDRLAAQLDGVVVAGITGHSLAHGALASPDVGSVFTAAVTALTVSDKESLTRLFALCEAAPELTSGLASAFGWVSVRFLRGITMELLDAPGAYLRAIGLATCAMHGVAHADALQQSAASDAQELRARALRYLGETGVANGLDACLRALHDEDSSCRCYAARSAVLLGNRGAALAALARAGQRVGEQRPQSFRLALQAMDIKDARYILHDLATDPTQLRWLIQGCGIVGDPAYIPWLLGRLEENETARLAGEAFSLITGLDLALLDLERPPPEEFDSGPKDDPDVADVELDPDEGLPWPDRQKLEQWWAVNGHAFQSGRRYFMGVPIVREHCLDVLTNGYQRQRCLAAQYLCLLEPGTALFNTSAPARRQQRWLAKMS